MSGGRSIVWAAGFTVAAGAGAATAHGLYEVAAAAGVPAPIAWLYPLITDGLALVAYSAAANLTGRQRAHAWAVVVLAAGLSGLAQATYLAGAVRAAPVALRFGVGAWPAIAGATAAHLLHLLARTERQPVRRTGPDAFAPTEPTRAPDAVVRTPVDGAEPRVVPAAEGSRPLAPPKAAHGPAGTSRQASARPARTDAELLTVLATRSAPMSVRAAARELGCGFDRARRLLRQAGLLTPNTPTRQENDETPTDSNTDEKTEQ
jgi:hypothetical protein